MALRSDLSSDRRPSWGTLAIAVLALVGAMLVFVVNGGPLFYFDTAVYIGQGNATLHMILPHSWFAAPVAGAASEGGLASGGVGGTVNGSRSIVYSLMLASADQLRLLWAFPVFQAGAVALTLWLVVKTWLRSDVLAAGPGLVIAVSILAASFGALPFYIAFLMPDIFAPLLILLAATVTIWGRSMTKAELLLAAVIAGVGVVSHPSHLLIAAGMIPLALIFGPVTGRRGWWIGLAFLLVICGVGAAERFAFTKAVETVSKAEVTYMPFLTARSIADGPGYAYLTAHCPDAKIATCTLFAALQSSTDPMRLTATNIIFAKTPELGSFALMEDAVKARIASDQIGFYLAVMREFPLRGLYGIVRNTLVQAGLNSVEMTVPTSLVVDNLRQVQPQIGPARLTTDRSWLPPVEWLHDATYVLSLLVIVALVLWPGRVPARMRWLAVFVVLGILANAFVCGAVSQPANRYGARVIWLLPLIAAVLAFYAWPIRRRGGVAP